jgi:hypothetical protein
MRRTLTTSVSYALASLLIFMILPMRFKGPVFIRCTQDGERCADIYTTVWRWFGGYHVLFHPFVTTSQVDYVKDFQYVYIWEVIVGGAVACVLGFCLYIAIDSIRLKVHHEKGSG